MPLDTRLLIPKRPSTSAPQLLLDGPGAGARAAFSLRKLSASYSGAVVRVRRSSDSAELDFTAAEIDSGALASWVGAGNDGFVRTWYDQTGNAFHLQQATAASQPRIVGAGAVELMSGKPSIRHPTSIATLQTASSLNASQPNTILAVFAFFPAALGSITHFIDGVGGRNVIYGNPNNIAYFAGAQIFTGFDARNASGQIIAVARYHDAGSSFLRAKGGVVSTVTPGTQGIGNLVIGASGFIGHSQEVVVWNNATVVAADVDQNANLYYANY